MSESLADLSLKEAVTKLLLRIGELLIKVIPLLVRLFWPVALLVAMRTEQLHFLLWVLLAALLFEWALSLFDRPIRLGSQVRHAVCTGLCVASLVAGTPQWIFWYPVIVNVLLFKKFYQSLAKEPICTEFAILRARMKDPDVTVEQVLPAAAISYTRTLTQIWCGFFVVNGSLALATTLYGDPKLWWLWNGCWSYIAIALFFVIEYGVRRWKMAHA